MTDTGVGVGNDRKVALLLIVAAVALYLPAIGWGLPHATAPDRVFPWGSDELAPLMPVGELYRVFVDPNPLYNPQYPLLAYVQQAVAIAPYLLLQMLTGGLTQPSAVFPHGFADPLSALAATTILARLVSLAAGVGVVLAAWRTGSILWSRRAGIMAAVLVLVTYAMFYYSRTSNTDMAALFWTSLGFAVFASCLRNGLTIRRGLWLGVLAALATSTKDASFFAFLGMAPALVPWRTLAGGGAAGARQAWAPVGVGLVAAAAVYAVASGLVFNLERFRIHVDWVLHSTAAYLYPETAAGNMALLGETTGHIVAALGAIAAIAAVTGLALALRSDRKALLLALPAVAIIAGAILPVRFVNFRYVMVVAYLGALFAAYTFDKLMDSSGVAWIRQVARAAFAIAVFWGLVRGIDLTYQMLNDSRYALADWFDRNARAGDRVAYWSGTQKLPALGPGITTVPAGQFCTAADWRSGNAPEFVAVIPQQHFELEHERALPEDLYAGFVDGSLGYTRAVRTRSPSLLSSRPVPFVNPLVQVFVRNDVVPRLRDAIDGDAVPRPLLEPVEDWLGVGRKLPSGLVANPDLVVNPCSGGS